MIEGESGLLNVFPPDKRPLYEPSKRRITFHTGAIATAYSADEPERLRGPQHDTAWCDEICSWRYPTAYDMLMFGLRLGEPQNIITTTPKPTNMLREIIKNSETVITKGTTYDNRENLAKSFFTQIISKYEGTRLGRQELNAELLDDTVGALWKLSTIDNNRVKEIPELKRIVVAIDPAVSTNKDSDETGIIVAGLGMNDEGYILDDLTIKAKPNEWATAAIEAYHKWAADKIIGEANNGGDMVKYTLETIDKTVPIRLVHAARGKQTRAEPISALYDQGRIHHVGSLTQLEDQMTCWIPNEGSSPDRVDALVWAIWELMIDGKKTHKIFEESFGGVTSASTWGIV
jgi:phage terminase large subunit-like protein